MHPQLASCQSISGTGALHLIAVLIKRCCDVGNVALPQVYIPEPTWSNHHQVFASVGYKCNSFSYYNSARKAIDYGSYVQRLRTAQPGSIVIFHACAHNPTGLDPTKQQWQEIGQIVKDRGLYPLFDAAYLGFNSGNVDEDAYAIRHFVNDLNLDAAICLSFAKNMGLYGMLVNHEYIAHLVSRPG